MRFPFKGTLVALAALAVALTVSPLLAVAASGEISSPSSPVVVGEPVTVAAWVTGACSPVLLVAPTSGDSVKLAVGNGGAFCTDKVTLSGAWTALTAGEYTVKVIDGGGVVLSRTVTATAPAPSPTPDAATAAPTPTSGEGKASPTPNPTTTVPLPADNSKGKASPSPSPSPRTASPSPSPMAAPTVTVTPVVVSAGVPAAVASPTADDAPEEATAAPTVTVTATPTGGAVPVAFREAADAFPVGSALAVGGYVVASLGVAVLVTWLLCRVLIGRGHHHG